MTRTININEVNDSFQAVLALTRNGDEVVVEENGEPLVKIMPVAKPEIFQRIPGLREGRSWMSDDFDDELPDEFWGWNK